MGKSNSRVFAALGATAVLTFGGAASALAAGTLSQSTGRAAARASTTDYKGKTSQRLPFSITRSGRKVNAVFNFKAKCSSGPLKSVKSEAAGSGKVKSGKFSATGEESYPAGGGYMGLYKLKATGKISSTKTSGTFSVSNGIFNVTTGKQVGTCNTGKQTFKGHKV